MSTRNIPLLQFALPYETKIVAKFDLSKPNIWHLNASQIVNILIVEVDEVKIP